MSNTLNYNLNKPTYGTRNWDIPLNENFDTIDSTMKSIDDKIGNLSNSTTTDKSSVINITNEINANVNTHLADFVSIKQPPIPLVSALGGGNDDGSAIKAIIDFVSLNGGGTVFIPDDEYHSSIEIPVPVNVNIQGGGMYTTILRFTGATNGLKRVETTDYVHCGFIKDIQIQGSDTALIGIWLEHLNHPILERVYVRDFVRQGVYFNYCLMAEFNKCLIMSNGGTGYAQVEIDNSTTFMWYQSRIASGNTNCPAGLKIDRTIVFDIIGGAIESTGIPVQLCSKSEGSGYVGFGVIHLDMENPGDNNPYIEAGYGWTGSNGQGVRRVDIINTSTSPSGTATIPYGIKLKHTDSCCISRTSISQPSTGAICHIWLEGTTNLRFSTGINGGADSIPWIFENGVERKDAKPDVFWSLRGQAITLARATSFAQNSTTPSAAGYSRVGTNSTVATTITNILDGVDCQVLYIFAGDTNTTLKHNNTGTGKILLKNNADLTLSVGRYYHFIYDSSQAAWIQI